MGSPEASPSVENTRNLQHLWGHLNTGSKEEKEVCGRYPKVLQGKEKSLEGWASESGVEWQGEMLLKNQSLRTALSANFQYTVQYYVLTKEGNYVR